MGTRLEHGTAILESKVFRNADVIAVGEYLRSWRVNVKNEPRERRLLDDDRPDRRRIDNFALDTTSRSTTTGAAYGTNTTFAPPCGRR